VVLIHYLRKTLTKKPFSAKKKYYGVQRSQEVWSQADQETRYEVTYVHAQLISCCALSLTRIWRCWSAEEDTKLLFVSQTPSSPKLLPCQFGPNFEERSTEGQGALFVRGGKACVRPNPWIGCIAWLLDQIEVDDDILRFLLRFE
jgi:hypothetical protein